jgi:hypothetical protein
MGRGVCHLGPGGGDLRRELEFGRGSGRAVADRAGVWRQNEAMGQRPKRRRANARRRATPRKLLSAWLKIVGVAATYVGAVVLIIGVFQRNQGQAVAGAMMVAFGVMLMFAGRRVDPEPPPPVSPRKRVSNWLRTVGVFAAYIGVFLFLFGVVYLPSALSAQRADVELRETGAPASGNVVEIERSSTPHARPGGGSATYYPRTEQVIAGGPSSTSWKRYQTTDADFWATGTQLPLLYDAASPDRMIIHTEEASRLLGRRIDSNQRLVLVGGPMGAVGFALLSAGRRIDPVRRKRKRTKRLSGT